MGLVDDLLSEVPPVVEEVLRKSPLCQNMTNYVVQNFAANVALAIGGSPIMSDFGDEAEDLAKLDSSLVINLGINSPQVVENFTQALKFYNTFKSPVLLDPVGVGSTRHRQAACKTILGSGYVDVIKGNEGEILFLSLGQNTQRGVDSAPSQLQEAELARAVKFLALNEGCIVLMTGPTDILSDGTRVIAIDNGHSYLPKITGTGCTLGTAIACFLAAHAQDLFVATLSATLLFEIGAEFAALDPLVKGPGSFVPVFIDKLHELSSGCANGRVEWLGRAKVREIMC